VVIHGHRYRWALVESLEGLLSATKNKLDLDGLLSTKNNNLIFW
jgi:hypothetical protein